MYQAKSRNHGLRCIVANIMREHFYFLSFFFGNELESYSSSHFTKVVLVRNYMLLRQYIVIEVCNLI